MTKHTRKIATTALLFFVLTLFGLPARVGAEKKVTEPVEPFLLYYKGQAFPAYKPDDHGRLLEQLAKGEAAQKQVKVLQKQGKLTKDIQSQLKILQKAFDGLRTGLEKERELRAKLHEKTDKIIRGKDEVIALKDKRVVELKKRIKPLIHEPLFWVGIGVATVAGVGLGIGVGVALAR